MLNVLQGGMPLFWQLARYPSSIPMAMHHLHTFPTQYWELSEGDGVLPGALSGGGDAEGHI